MKIVAKNNKETISVDEITESHTIVGKWRDVPVIITGLAFDRGKYKVTVVNNGGITRSNGYISNDPVEGFSSAKTLTEFLTECLSKDRVELHAFANYRDALQWLLDN
jgi:hypothetical protein